MTKQTHQNPVKQTFEVHTEDLWDYYKVPSIRPKIGEFATYEEAVAYAKEWVKSNLATLLDDPASCYIFPEPEGRHFDSRKYEEELRNPNK